MRFIRLGFAASQPQPKASLLYFTAAFDVLANFLRISNFVHLVNIFLIFFEPQPLGLEAFRKRSGEVPFAAQNFKTTQRPKIQPQSLSSYLCLQWLGFVLGWPLAQNRKQTLGLRSVFPVYGHCLQRPGAKLSYLFSLPRFPLSCKVSCFLAARPPYCDFLRVSTWPYPCKRSRLLKTWPS